MTLPFGFLAAVCLVSVSAAAQDGESEGPTSDPIQSNDNCQAIVVVRGKVAEVTIRRRFVLLSLDERYPNSPVTAVIPAQATNEFGDLSQLEGKWVEIRGRIVQHGGQSQIILHSTNHLRVIEPPRSRSDR